jgi:hypothetical protein
VQIDLPAIPTIEVPDSPTIEVPEFPTIEVPDVTLPVIPTVQSGGPIPDDIPVVDNPQDLFTTADAVTYTTDLPFDEVLEFYQTEMAAAGWEEIQEPITFGDSAVLNYARGDRVASVTISTAGSTTSVLVGLATN